MPPAPVRTFPNHVFSESRERWLDVARASTPRLQHRTRHPLQIVEGNKNPAAHQGWEMIAVGDPATLRAPIWKPGQSFILDFGSHTVGYLEFELSVEGYGDAPARLQLTFAEVAAEACEPFDPYLGGLCRAWLQDETVNVDVLPARVVLPRRYAFRYVKMTVLAASPSCALGFGDFLCTAVSSSPLEQASEPPPGLPDEVLALDTVSLRTLSNCMQAVFEDGPKRDRRLWMGDLRLQALANYVSFRNFDLVKRCLYLFAALAREDGVLPACVFEFPQPHRGSNYILDYEALFIPTLLEYASESGDWDCARELWPVAWQQVKHLDRYVDERGLFHDPGNYWLFIDWRKNLEKQTSLQGVIIYALRAALTLASRLGQDEEAVRLREKIAAMTKAAHAALLSREIGLFISGPDQQVSWASQVWMILAGVVEPGEGDELLGKLLAHPGAVTPAGPYLYHYVVEAMFQMGRQEEAVATLRRYWGDMLRKGATTFWEVHDPKDPFLSPYRSHLINSYCHAWSCTPCLLHPPPSGSVCGVLISQERGFAAVDEPAGTAARWGSSR